MRLEDLTVEVRDPQLNRIGVITPENLVGATFVARFNNVGSWSIQLPYNDALGELLRQPGYGIILTGPGDQVILSGPTNSAKLEQNQTNTDGDWLIEGVTDNVVLAERLAYPTPSTDDVTAQTDGSDIRTGAAETVIKEYVDVNLGPGAVTSREVTGLSIQADQARGSTVFANARFDQVQELIYNLAQVGGIGYDLKQQNGGLEFSVFQPTDRSDTIRMDIQNRKLSSSIYKYATANVTRAIVGGRGEAENRIFAERSNADSLAAESSWNRRIERFVDARQSEATNELNTAGDELLVDEGKTIVEMSVTPSDDQTMLYGTDWFLGDKVTVVANDVEAKAVVTEVGVQISNDGVRIGATVGTPIGLEFENKLLTKVNTQDARISNLERATTGYGVNTSYQPSGGSSGTQPVFDPADIVGTFNRFGNMVHFQVSVDFDNITDFGTGRYYITLPFQARTEYTFASGHLTDVSQNKLYLIIGYVQANSNQVDLYYLGSSGILEDFTHNAPKTLSTADSFDISGTFEIEG